MAKIKKLDSLKVSFDTHVNNFCENYNNVSGNSVCYHSVLDYIDHKYRFRIRLSELPKSRSKKGAQQKVSVFIEAFISGDSLKNIFGYGTRISYINVDSQKYEYLEGFHFDYRKKHSEIIQGGHPIFHLQLAKTAAQSYVSEALFGAVEEQKSPDYFLREIRIPSAQMDVFSCVLMVLADHLYCNPVKADFEALVKKIHPLIPGVNVEGHDETTKSLFGQRTMTSPGWYFASF